MARMPTCHSEVASCSRRATAPRASTSRPESISSRMHNAGREHAELHHLGPLLLATGQVDVERAGQQARLEPDGLRPRRQALVERGAVRPVGGGVQQGAQPDPGHLHRMLQGQEHAGPGPLPGRQPHQFLAVEANAARP